MNGCMGWLKHSLHIACGDTGNERILTCEVFKTSQVCFSTRDLNYLNTLLTKLRSFQNFVNY